MFFTVVLPVVLLVIAFNGVVARIDLFNLFGFDYSLAAALFVAMVSGWLNQSVLRLKHDLKISRKLILLYRVHFFLLLALLGGILLISLVVPTCNYRYGAAFFLLNPVITALFSIFLSLAIHLLVGGKWRSILLNYLSIFGFIGFTLGKIVFSPVIFGFDFLFGYFPGAIYDEALPLENRFILFRFYTVVSAIVIFLAAYWWNRLRKGEGVMTAFSQGKRLLGLTFVLVFVFLFFFLFQEGLDFHHSRSYVKRALGGERNSAHFVYHYANDPRVEAQMDEIIADHEFRYEQIVAMLSIEQGETIHSYIYKDEYQKNWLIGAKSTLIGNFFNGEIHLHANTVPNELLKHELTHVIAAIFGPKPIGAPLNMCIVEGLAVATNWTEGRVDPDELSCVLQSIPERLSIENLINPLSFWGKPGRLAYTLCGSFIRFLIASEGPEKVKLLYLTQDFQNAFGKTLAEAVQSWQSYLRQIVVTEAAKDYAEMLSGQKSIFLKRCAREAANLELRGELFYASADYKKATEEFGAAYLVSDKYPDYVPGYLSGLFRLGRYEEAGEIAAEIYTNDSVPIGYRIHARMVEANIAIVARRFDAAKRSLNRIIEADYSPFSKRLARFKIEAISDPEARENLIVMLTDFLKSNAVYREILRTWANRDYGDPLFTAFLLGESFFADSFYMEALDALRIFEDKDPLRSQLIRDGLFLRGQTLYKLKKYREAETVFLNLKRKTSDAYRVLSIDDWIERVRYSERIKERVR